MSHWTYAEAVRFLLSFVNYETLPGRRMTRRETDVTRFARALGRLQHPEAAAPVLHVAGTNGKGSTSAVAAALLRAEGVSTCLYTSPHLVDFTERIQVDGRAIPRGEFARAAEEAARNLGGGPGTGFQTTFEHLTAMAFLVARARGVGAQVVEVGLGGRLDSTNVVSPRVTVITPVSFDHREVLGETLAAIAGEKAGILKRGVPALIGRQAPAAWRVIEQRARRVGAPLERIESLEIREARPTARGEAFTLRTPRATYTDLVLALRGAHQLDNAALAIRAVELFLGRALEPAAVRRALLAVRWPGRFERLATRPPLVLDGAHNPDGARTLAETLARYYPGHPVVFVLGISAGKDLPGLLAPLRAPARAFVVTAAGHARAAEPDAVAAEVRRGFAGGVETARDLRSALIRARRLAGPDGVTVVAGSLYLVGDMRALWPGFRAPWAGRAPRVARPAADGRGRPPEPPPGGNETGRPRKPGTAPRRAKPGR